MRNVVIGFLGTQLDMGRRRAWRPSVQLCAHDGFPVDRLELIHDQRHYHLACNVAAAGSMAFYPASKIMTYEAFLVALFAIAAGCSILETSANPYVMSLGPEATATRRLNFAQAFNPVGTNIGVLLAATLLTGCAVGVARNAVPDVHLLAQMVNRAYEELEQLPAPATGEPADTAASPAKPRRKSNAPATEAAAKPKPRTRKKPETA